MSLAVLAVTAVAQALVFVTSGSAALLADLVHNVGDALTAFPVGLAFLLRSARAEKLAGLAVVFAIAASGVVAASTAVEKLINQEPPDHLLALAIAGIIGAVGNGFAARVRTSAGRKLGSPALIADAHPARMDALVNASVVATAIFVGIGILLSGTLGPPLLRSTVSPARPRSENDILLTFPVWN